MKILVVEDDPIVAETVRTSLVAENHTVEVVEDGANGAFMAKSYDYDIIILDHSLPKKDGLTVAKEIRAAGKTTPIIFLTADDDVETKVKAFQNGADDYMVKPFSLEELNARLKAINRRPSVVTKSSLHTGDLELDREKHLVHRSGRQIRLTRKEFGLLEYFMLHSGVVLSRTAIMEHVWTADSNPFSNTVEAHIRNLRKKIKSGKRPNMIANVPGRGYILDSPENLKKFN